VNSQALARRRLAVHPRDLLQGALLRQHFAAHRKT
jgi:hypothetical protein